MMEILDLFDKSWYTDHVRGISELVQDPRNIRPKPDTPILEIVVRGAELPPLPNQVVQTVQRPFVRLWIDGELVGETSRFEEPCAPSSRPVWNERLLVLPQGAACFRFEVCEDVMEFVAVRCSCAVSAPGLWEAVTNCGGMAFDQPLLHRERGANAKVGTLRLHIGLWNGKPAQDPQIRAAPS
mmetsp:Transcript_41919/g.115596  ORF Transcript_41919/g.115596 Transcript_41919/m.115596 type:complete len:183 (+) Transcript_41919:74-622(+)